MHSVLGHHMSPPWAKKLSTNLLGRFVKTTGLIFRIALFIILDIFYWHLVVLILVIMCKNCITFYYCVVHVF